MLKQNHHGAVPRLNRAERLKQHVKLDNSQQTVPNKELETPVNMVTETEENNVEFTPKKTRKVGWKMAFLNIFFSDVSIHGMKYLVVEKRTIGESIMWAIIIVAALYGAVAVSLNIWSRYNESPTVITIERNYLEFNTSFPTGTICPLKKVDEESLDKYVNGFPHLEDKEGFKKFLKQLANATYENFEYLEDFPNSPIKPEQYLDAILEIRFQVYIRVSNSEGKPDPDIIMSSTEMGLCYSYYSKVMFYSSPTYWKQNNWTVITLQQSENLYLNPIEGVRNTQYEDIDSPINFYFHSAEDAIDVSSKFVVPIDKFINEVKLQAMSSYTASEAKKLSVKQRKCRYPYENYLKISPIYSFKYCRIECRMRMAYHLCQCIPFFYRRIEGLPVCNVRGMRCLGYHKDTLISLSLPGHPHICNCLPVCDDVTFFLENMKSYEGLFNKGLNLQWRMENFPRMRVKRDMIFGFADLWVSIGGTGGLFLGCSVLSVIEIIYFFTLRLIIYVWNVKRKSSSKSKSFTKIG